MTPSSRTSKSLRGLALLVGVATAGLIAQYLHGRTNRELRDLPEADRRALYQRTLETLRTTCEHASGSQLTDYCRSQADFIERFPECDSECRELARRFHPQPTR